MKWLGTKGGSGVWQRIKRKAARWQRMFLAMRHGERAAVLAKLNEVAP
jgi:hypothetical protein